MTYSVGTTPGVTHRGQKSFSWSGPARDRARNDRRPGPEEGPGRPDHVLVELRGFEPLTFSLRTRRATNCATAPCASRRVAKIHERCGGDRIAPRVPRIRAQAPLARRALVGLARGPGGLLGGAGEGRVGVGVAARPHAGGVEVDRARPYAAGRPACRRRSGAWWAPCPTRRATGEGSVTTAGTSWAGVSSTREGAAGARGCGGVIGISPVRSTSSSSTCGGRPISMAERGARRRRSARTETRQATSQATSRVDRGGDPRPGDDRRGGEADDDGVGEHEQRQDVAATAGGATRGGALGLQRRRTPGDGGSRSGGRGGDGGADARALVSTGGRSAARIGETTRRALRRSTGSRRASTRIVWENFSTDLLRTTSSWCLRALGIR